MSGRRASGPEGDRDVGMSPGGGGGGGGGGGANAPRTDPVSRSLAGKGSGGGGGGAGSGEGSVTDMPPDTLGQRGGTQAGFRPGSQSVVTALVLLVSSGMVYGMRQYGRAAGMDLTRIVEIDYPLDRVGAPNADHIRIMADLERSGSPVQIPSERIHKNPFLLAAAPTPDDGADLEPADTSGDRQAAEARRAREDRAALVQSTFEGLQLHSVIAGRVPVARINDEMVKIGDRVAGLFMVIAIGDRVVGLEADGEIFMLDFEQVPVQAPRGNARQTKPGAKPAPRR